ncbi:MAG: histidine phosphatase family protein [Anaerolineae bacterium]|nr:hypothetical protein [Chloroflexota bacterium]
MVQHFYLIAEGQTDPRHSADPYNMPLTPLGAETMQRVARCSAQWGLQMLCSSTLRASLDSADFIEGASPVAVRWDLTELEDLVLDDLNYDPRATHLVSTWTEEQMEQGMISLWTRLVPAIVRISIYMSTMGVERTAIVSTERVLGLLLAHWLGEDWRLIQRARFSFDEVPVCHVAVEDDGSVTVGWLSCAA